MLAFSIKTDRLNIGFRPSCINCKESLCCTSDSRRLEVTALVASLTSNGVDRLERLAGCRMVEAPDVSLPGSYELSRPASKHRQRRSPMLLFSMTVQTAQATRERMGWQAHGEACVPSCQHYAVGGECLRLPRPQTVHHLQIMGSMDLWRWSMRMAQNLTSS
jgi:hypothetical protein